MCALPTFSLPPTFLLRLGKLDEFTINITSSSLRNALALSAADRRWIDFLSQTVSSTWDEQNPSRPKTLGYMGSEEFIRLQFEEYLIALLSAVKYHIYLESPQNAPLLSTEGDPSQDFNSDWIEAWRQTSSYALFASHTDSHLFDIVEPRHPTAGNLSLEDIQRRLAQQIQTLHLDDRLAASKDLLNRHLATGQKKVSTAFTNLRADLEALREAQRRKSEGAIPAVSTPKSSDSDGPSSTTPTLPSSLPTISSARRYVPRPPDLSTAQASVSAASSRAGAYISSWGAWASERRKGWGRSSGEPVNVGATDDAAPPSRKPSKESLWDNGGGKNPTKRRGKEEKGGDGIGRLDA